MGIERLSPSNQKFDFSYAEWVVLLKEVRYELNFNSSFHSPRGDESS